VLFAPAAAASNSACYGETLDLRLVSDQAPDSFETRMLLPETDLWIVNVGDGRNLTDVPCGPEPVVAVGVVSAVTHGVLPDSARNLLEQENVLLTIVAFSIISSGGLDAYQRSREWWLANVFSKATETNDGHLRKPSVQGDAVGGSWLLKDRHPKEAGDRIILGMN